jgi:branched-chain amino acid transport system permease protein
MKKIFFDLAGTALIAALLFLPFIGLRIDDATVPPTLSHRWGWAVLAIALAVVGRMAVHLFSSPRARGRAFGTNDRVRGFAAPSASPSPGQTKGLSDLSRRERKIPFPAAGKFLLCALAVSFPLLPDVDRESVDLVTLILIYAMLATGLNIVVGFTGLLDLGFIGFFAIGAYAYALLSTTQGLGFWECLPIAALLPAFISLILGVAVLRLRGDYFAIVTLGFGQIVYTLLVNWQGLTHGGQGITGIPRPTLFGLAEFSASAKSTLPTVSDFLHIAYSPVPRVIFLYYVILGLAAVAMVVSTSLRRLPLGQAWEAVREDEIAAASVGISPARVNMAAYAISAAIAGVAGAFFAAREGFVSPESFTFMDSAIVLAIVVLGGMGSQAGVVIAAFFLIGAPELIRGLSDYRMLIFGALMVAVMIVRPKGLIATRHPTVKL